MPGRLRIFLRDDPQDMFGKGSGGFQQLAAVKIDRSGHAEIVTRTVRLKADTTGAKRHQTWKSSRKDVWNS